MEQLTKFNFTTLAKLIDLPSDEAVEEVYTKFNIPKHCLIDMSKHSL